MNWGTKIVFAFISFATLIISMVVISMRQDISLVAKDYYVQELAYQDQIDKMENQMSLSGTPEVKFRSGQVEVKMNSTVKQGQLQLFRPSDASQDKTYALKSESVQYFNARTLKRGRWIAKIAWNDGQKDYYYEKGLFIP